MSAPSRRRAGRIAVAFGDDELLVEEVTPEALSAGDLDLCPLLGGNVGEPRARAARLAAGAVCVDKSSAYRLVDGYPLVVPEVNGARALEALESDRIVANPNCCTIPLSCVLKPLHDAAGVASVRVSTYQSVSGAGAHRMDHLRRGTRRPRPGDGLDVGGRRVRRGGQAPRGDAQDHRASRPADLRDLRARPGDGGAFGGDLGRARAAALARTTRQRSSARRRASASLDLPSFPTPGAAAGGDEVLVGRIRTDQAAENGLALYLSSDNLRKGAALNAIQIAELLLADTAVSAPVRSR